MKKLVNITYRVIFPLILAISLVFAYPFSVFFDSPVNAQIPQFINYQGKLKDGGGIPLSGTYDFRMRIYDDLTAGNLLYAEEQLGITVKTGGIFDVQVGTGTVLTPPNNPFSTLDFTIPYYLTVEVGQSGVWDGEMSPRVALATYMYAFNASRLDGHSAGTGADDVLLLDGSGDINFSGDIITPGNIESGAITISGSEYTAFLVVDDITNSVSMGIYVGHGTPDGWVVATPGSLFMDETGELFLKESGTGNTGWVNMATTEDILTFSLWEDGTFGTYEDDAPVLITSSGDIDETIVNAGFSLASGNLFVEGDAGVAGDVYTNGSFIAGSTLTMSDGSITQSASGTGDLTISTTGGTSGNLVVETAGHFFQLTDYSGGYYSMVADDIDLNTAGSGFIMDPYANEAYLNSVDMGVVGFFNMTSAATAGTSTQGAVLHSSNSNPNTMTRFAQSVVYETNQNGDVEARLYAAIDPGGGTDDALVTVESSHEDDGGDSVVHIESHKRGAGNAGNSYIEIEAASDDPSQLTWIEFHDNNDQLNFTQYGSAIGDDLLNSAGEVYSDTGVIGSTIGAGENSNSLVHALNAVATYVANIGNTSSLRNIVQVRSGATEVPGKLYSTIANAITYVNSQTPSATNRWKIRVEDDSNAESFTVPQFTTVEGYGFFTNTTLTGNIVLSGSSVLENLTHENGTIDSNGSMPNIFKRIMFTGSTINANINTVWFFTAADKTAGGSVVNINHSGCEIVQGSPTFQGGINVNNGGSVTLMNTVVRSVTVANGGNFEANASKLEGDLTINAGGHAATYATAIDGTVNDAGSWNNYANMYDNSASGLTAENTQDAIDELEALIAGVSGEAFVQDGNSFGSLATLGTNDMFGLAFETGGVEAMRIDDNGRVGIGTNTPRADLDVVGNLIAEGGVIHLGEYNLMNDGTYISLNDGSQEISMQATGEIIFGDDEGMNNGTTFRFSDALSVSYFDGVNVGIGTSNPRAQLELGGGDGSILAIGSFASGWTEPDLGAGTRLLWTPEKSAFRVGTVDGIQWDHNNMGDYSMAMGSNPTASGYAAVAIGSDTIASGARSTAMGMTTTASGYASTAMGLETIASGMSSTAMGVETIASGTASTAIGRGIEAGSDYVVAIGLNDQTGTNCNQANSMCIMGGNVGIGTTTPSTVLHIDNNSANTTAILTLENTAGDVQFFRTDATPEGSVTGSVGDLAMDGTSGILYIKESGNGTNTGWDLVATGAGVTAGNGLTLNGTVIELGGTIGAPTTIDGHNTSLRIDIHDGLTESRTQDAINGGYAGFLSNIGTSTKMYTDGTGATQSSLEITQSAMTVTDGNSSKGLVYAQDYSANFTDRSLVDKEYVDDAITTASVSAGNGLTLTAGVMDLGGDLTGDTYINHQGFSFIVREFAGETETEFNGDNFKIINSTNGREVRYGISSADTAGLSFEGANQHNLYYRDDSIFVSSDAINFEGLEYALDYSANFTDRSLVDKEYVDDAVSGGRLWSRSGTNLSPVTAGDDVLLNAGETLSVSDMTQGSIAFFGASGLMSQDNTNLFWDDSSNRLGIGTNSPSTDLEVAGNIMLDDYVYFNNAAAEYLRHDGATFVLSDDLLPSADDTYSLGSSTFRWSDLYVNEGSVHIGSNGDETVMSYNTVSDLLTFQNSADSTTGFQFLDADGGTPILSIDTSTESVGIGTASPSQRLDLIGNFELESTTSDSTGIIYKGGDRFIHNFHHPTGSAAVPIGRNTFMGVNAGNFTMGSGATTVVHASYNTVVGANAFVSNTIGFRNSVLGNEALYSNTVGNDNVAIGDFALYLNTEGHNNAAMGSSALYSNTEGDVNIAIGRNALYSNTLGSYNVAVGYNTFAEITEGVDNTVLGSNSGRGITTGDYNTILGANVTGLAADLSNNIIIADGQGNQRINVISNGNVGIGDVSPAALLTVGSGDLFQVDSSGDIISIDGVSYNWPSSQGGVNTVLTNNGSGVLSWGSVGSDTDWSGAGTGQMYATSITDDVGIGLTTPGYTLDVSDEIGLAGTRMAYVTGNELTFGDTDGGGYDTVVHSDSDYIAFSVVGSEKMRIDTSGSVAIGTTSLEDRLHIAGGNVNIDKTYGIVFDSTSFGRIFLDDGTNQANNDLLIAADLGGSNSVHFVASDDPSSSYFAVSPSQVTVSAGGTLSVGATSGLIGGNLRLAEGNTNGSNYVGFRAPASVAANVLWILPNADGGNGDALITDGAGNLSWSTVGSTSPWGSSGGRIYPAHGGDDIDLGSGETLTLGSVDVGQVMFSGTARIVSGDNNFFWDNTNKRLGIGTTVPSNRLSIVGESTTGDSSVASINMTMYDDTVMTAPTLQFVRGGGSVSSPTAVQYDMGIGMIFGMGYDGSSYEYGSIIQMIASENWTTSNHGSRINFMTTANGATSPVERLRIANNGAITFNQAYTFPTADGTNGQVLQTDGGGALSWVNGGGGGTLDQAYDFGGAGVGRQITADSGAMEITVPDTSSNAGLVINQNDTTNNPNALQINHSGTGYGLYVAEDSTGSDNVVARFSNIQTAAAATNYIVVDAGGYGTVIGGMNSLAGSRGVLTAADFNTSTYAQLWQQASDYVFQTGGAFGSVQSALTIANDGNAVFATDSDSTTNAYQFTNLGTGNSFVVNDQNADTTPFVIDNSGLVGIGTTSPSNRLDVSGNIGTLAQGGLRFYDTDSSNYVAFQAPGTVSSDVTWTLPGVDGMFGDVLQTNGIGTLSWTGNGGSALWTKVGTDLSPASSGDSVVLNDGEDLSISSLIEGAVLFAGPSGLVSEDNMHLFWDNANDRLGIGTASPTALLHLDPATASRSQFRLESSAGTDPTTPNSGDLWWDGTNLNFYDGSSTNDLLAGGAFSTTSNVTSNSPGTFATDDLVFGSPQLDDDGDTDHDSRMFFDKSKAAFRAGTVSLAQWDDANVGAYSVAIGRDTTASGISSTALGYYTTASGNYSTAFGIGTTASQPYATAFGSSTTASGEYALVMGRGTTASGESSTAFGFDSTALGDYSTAMGYDTVASGTISTAIGQDSVAAGWYSFTGGRNMQPNSGSATFVWGNAGSSQVFSPADNRFLIFPQGNAGMVGIGTVTPSTTLHVDSNAVNTTAMLTLQNTAGDFQVFRTDTTPESQVTGSVGDLTVDSNNGIMYIKASGNGTNTGWVEMATGSGADSDWSGAGTGTMYATSTTDKVAIGSSSPTYPSGQGRPLYVEGSGTFQGALHLTGAAPRTEWNATGNTSGSRAFDMVAYADAIHLRMLDDTFTTANDIMTASLSEIVFNEDSTDQDFRIEGNSNANLFFANAGNDRVGIGTNDPDTMLHLFAGNSGASPVMPGSLLTMESSGDSYLSMLTPNTASSRIVFGDPENHLVGQIVYDHSADEMLLRVNNDYRMAIKSNGRVGIGTTTPAQMLDVFGNIASNGASVASYSGGDMIVYLGDLDGGNASSLDIRAGAGPSTVMRIESDGDVGIGTGLGAINATLDVRGSAVFNDDGGDYDFRVESDTNASMFFVDAGNNRVGLGTSSPIHTLHVSGDHDNGRILIHDADGNVDDEAGLLFAVSGNLSTSPAKGGIFFNREATYGRGDLIFAVDNNADSTEVTKDDIRMSIQSGGEVIVGTASPTHVSGQGSLFVDQYIEIGKGLYIYDDIVHSGDTDTSIGWGTDSVRINAGGVRMIDFIEGTSDSVVINETSADVDFRVESDGNANMLFVNAGNNRVGIGTNTPVSIFEIEAAIPIFTIDSGDSYDAEINLSENGSVQWNIFNDGDNADRLAITDNDNNQGVYLAQDATSWTANSDARLKENVVTIDNALDSVLNMRGVRYNFIGTGKTEIGVIAQEVNGYFPEIVDASGEYMGVSYSRIGPILIEAIKEQHIEVDELGDMKADNELVEALGLEIDEVTGEVQQLDTGLAGVNGQIIELENRMADVESAIEELEGSVIIGDSIEVAEVLGVVKIVGEDGTELEIKDGSLYVDGEEFGTAAILPDDPSFESMTVVSRITAGELVIGGNASVGGSLVVTGDITAMAGLKVIGHITVGTDTAGEVVIPAGASEVEVIFDQPYADIPVVNVTAEDFFGGYAVSERSVDGFKIKLSEVAAADVNFQWFVFEVE